MCYHSVLYMYKIETVWLPLQTLWCTVYCVLVCLILRFCALHTAYSIHHLQQPNVCILFLFGIFFRMICNMFNSARESCAEVDKTCNNSWIVQRIEYRIIIIVLLTHKIHIHIFEIQKSTKFQAISNFFFLFDVTILSVQQANCRQ